MKWSDIPTLHGQQPQLPEYQYIQESDVYTIAEKTVDLTQEYSTYSEVEVYSTMKLNVQFLSTDSDKHETDLYSKYFEKITQCLLSTTNNLFEVNPYISHSPVYYLYNFVFLQTLDCSERFARKLKATTFAIFICQFP